MFPERLLLVENIWKHSFRVSTNNCVNCRLLLVSDKLAANYCVS